MKAKIIIALVFLPAAFLFNSCYVEEAPHADVHVDEIYESTMVVYEDIYVNGRWIEVESHLLSLEIEFENYGNKMAHDVQAFVQIYDIYGGMHEYELNLGDIPPYADRWHNFTSNVDESVVEDYEIFVDWYD